MIKIDSNKIQKYGTRGFALTIPKIWIKDNLLNSGDKIDIYRDETDRLILVANKKEEKEKEKVEAIN